MEKRIRELAKPIAERKGLSVDGLLDTICFSEGPGYETTYREAYIMAFLDGIEEGLAETAWPKKNTRQ